MRLKEKKKLLQKFAASLKKFSAQGAKKVEYGSIVVSPDIIFISCHELCLIHNPSSGT